MANRTDNFNRADSSTTINSPSDGGSDWVPAGTTVWGIATNTGRQISGSGFHVYMECGFSTQDVEATMSAYDSDMSLTARVVDSTNYMLGVTRASGNTVEIYKVVAGSFTSLATGTATWATSDVIKFAADADDLLTLYQNDVSRASVTDATHSTATKAGLWQNSVTTPRWNDFSITNNAASPSFNPAWARNSNVIIGAGHA